MKDAAAGAGRVADKKSAAPTTGGIVKNARPSQPPLDAHAASGPPKAATAAASSGSASNLVAPAAVSDGEAIASPVAGKRTIGRNAVLSSHGGGRGCSSQPLIAATRKMEPRLRPKKTHAGLEEKMEATGNSYGVYVHWDRYAGHHVHVLPPEIDAMHVEDMLLVPSGCEGKTKEKADPSGRGLLLCGPALAAASTSSATDDSVVTQTQRQQQQGRHRRHCIPLYRYQPKLCEKSRRIVDEHRESRLSELWQKIDLHAEGVVDFFSVPWLLASAPVYHSHRNGSADLMLSTDSCLTSSGAAYGMHEAVSSSTAQEPSGESAVVRNTPSAMTSGLYSAADLPHGKQLRDRRGIAAESGPLSPIEERFLDAALLPHFVMTAMLPENQTAARAVLTGAAAAAAAHSGAAAPAGAAQRLGAAVAAHDWLKDAKALAIARNLVLLLDVAEGNEDAVRLPHGSGVSAAANEGEAGVLAAAAAGVEQTTAGARKRHAGKEKAEAGEPVDNEVGTTGNGSRGIMRCLLVPKAAFIKAGRHALQRCFGETTPEAAAAVDAFRDLLMREYSEHVQAHRRQRQQQRNNQYQKPLYFHQQPLRSSWEPEHLQQRQLRGCMSDVRERETSAEYVTERSCSPYCKPYILHYARQLEHKRRKADQQADAVLSAALAAPSRDRAKGDDDSNLSRPGTKHACRRYPPRCLQPLPLSAAADWAGAVAPTLPGAAIAAAGAVEVCGGMVITSDEPICAETKFPASGLRRVRNRFDEQIAHHLRKKLQLEHLKRAMDDMQEREFCSFHPAVNKTPRYLKQIRKEKRLKAALLKEGGGEEQQQQQRRTDDWLPQQMQKHNRGLLSTSSEAAADPMEVLTLYCKYYTEDPRYEQLVQEIRECCFQPNIFKFVNREKKRQHQLERQEIRREELVQQQDVKEELARQNRGDGGDEQQQKQLGMSRTTASCRTHHGNVAEMNTTHSKAARTSAAAGKEGKTRAACKAGEATTCGAAADELFAMLDAPFDAIFQTDIRQWLHSRDGTHYSKSPHAREKAMLRSHRKRADGAATSDADVCETSSETESSEEEASPQQQERYEWKNWIREKRQPQYRGPRERKSCVKEVLSAVLQDRVAVAAGDPLAADAAFAVRARAAASAASAEKAAKLRFSNAYNSWVEGLRGGYLSNPMDFSMPGEDARGEDEKKTRRYGMRDWSRYIRLEQRAVEARVVPNREIADSICETYMPSAEAPEPTVWNPRRSRWKPAEEEKPSACTYTQANYWSGISEDFHSRGGRELACSALGQQRDVRDVPDAAALSAPLPSASRAAQYAQQQQHRQQVLLRQQPQQPEVRGLLRMCRSGEKRSSVQNVDPTTFVLPTPAKAHKIREQFRVYLQLRHGIDSGEIYVPPRVCALKRTDALQLLEKEIEEEVPQLLLLTQNPEEGTLLSELKEDTEQQQHIAAEPPPDQPQWDGPEQQTAAAAEEDLFSRDAEEANELSWSRASTAAAAAEWGAEEEEQRLADARKSAPQKEAAATEAHTLRGHSQGNWTNH